MKRQRASSPAVDAGFRIENGFDNANPQDGSAIERHPDGVWSVHQFIEPGAPTGYSFHLHVALCNDRPAPLRVRIRIVWAEQDFDFCRDYMYIGYDSGADWRMLSTHADQGVTELEVVVPHGRHLLCAQPKFDTTDAEATIKRFGATERLESFEVGCSAGGRPLRGLRCGYPEGRVVVVTTRAHGYETAGAYCMRGLFADMDARPEAWAAVLERLNLYFFPMINVDAVARGHGCLAPSGVNFGNELAARTGSDAGADALRDFIFALCPEYYLDMHNNTGPHLSDAFRCSDPDLLAAFTKCAPDRARDQKVWAFKQLHWPAGYMLEACRRRFGTRGLLTEFPWYLRLPADMERHGCAFFQALLPLLAEDEALAPKSNKENEKTMYATAPLQV